MGEVNSAGAVTAQYAQGAGVDEPLAATLGDTLAFYEADGLGSVTSLTNSAGSALGAYIRDSFGKAVSTADTLGNRFRYTAREWDEETGLYYYRARYYDPQTGRFISEDPIRFKGGINLFAYTRNRPAGFTDPFGYQECNAAQWAQSPYACAGPQDPDAPYQGPDGLWYNVPEWHPYPTPPASDPNTCHRPASPPVNPIPQAAVPTMPTAPAGPFTQIATMAELLGKAEEVADVAFGIGVGVSGIAATAYICYQTGGFGCGVAISTIGTSSVIGGYYITTNAWNKLTRK